MNISLIITLYPPHFKYIIDLIKNIEQFTLLPAEVIISVSEYNDTIPMINSSTLNIRLLPINIKQNAAQNRNRAINVAIYDYVCIVDGDDLVHLKKLEICSNIVKNNPEVTLLLHNYDFFKEKQIWNINKSIDDSNIKIHECFINPTCTNLMTSPTQLSLHHAHVFFKKSIFNDIKYREDICYERIEDGLFCQDVLRRFGKVYMIDLNLIGYRNSFALQNM